MEEPTVIYMFYYTLNERVGTDDNYDSIWEDCRYELGAYFNYNKGLAEVQDKYKHHDKIKCQHVYVL